MYRKGSKVSCKLYKPSEKKMKLESDAIRYIWNLFWWWKEDSMIRDQIHEDVRALFEERY